MKQIITILLLFFSCHTFGQNIDSLTYEYGQLYYHIYGGGETVIILSGGPGNYALQLESVAQKLSKSYRVILLEQRGTGLSIPAKYDSTTVNLEAALSDINLLLTHLKLQKAIFFGHSYGASLAMVYASKFPQKVKSLIMLAPGYCGLGYPMQSITIDNLLSKLGKQEIERSYELNLKVQSGTISDSEKIELSKIQRLPFIYEKSKIDSLMPLIDGQINVNTFQLLIADFMKHDFNMSKDLQKIKCPIYLICGRQDFLTFIAYELKIAKPSINLYWIDKSGHFPMHEQPEIFYDILFKILRK